MNIQKLIAIVAAILINVAVLAWFHAWTSTLVASAAPPPVHAHRILTLPAVNVYPSAAQLRTLKRARRAAPPKQADAGGLACIDMPFYSFAKPCDVAVSG